LKTVPLQDVLLQTNQTKNQVIGAAGKIGLAKASASGDVRLQHVYDPVAICGHW